MRNREIDMKDFDSALASYVANVENRRHAHYDKHFAMLEKEKVSVAGGRKYKKVVMKSGNGQTFVHSFVNTENGDVYMAASWKAPTLNAARGNIFFNNGDDALTKDGSVRYL